MRNKSGQLKPTPETDSETNYCDAMPNMPWVDADFARRLERERDEARERLARLREIRSLQPKLNEARADAKEWRDRALSAEHVVAHKFPQALKDSVLEHDKKFGTSLRWGL